MSVGKQVAVGGSLLEGLGVKRTDAGGILAVSVVAVDDAGEVLVLVVARARELVQAVADRDGADGDEESGLFVLLHQSLFVFLSLSCHVLRASPRPGT